MLCGETVAVCCENRTEHTGYMTSSLTLLIYQTVRRHIVLTKKGSCENHLVSIRDHYEEVELRARLRS
jgi:hypothetical protein